MSKTEDKMMVHAYFNSMLLSNEAWWLEKESSVNFHLLQTPTKVRPFSKTRYVYKPSVVSESTTLKPGAIVNVIGVTEGEDASTTAVKVMANNKFLTHIDDYNRDCRRIWPKEQNEDGPCDCEKPIEEMPDPMRSNTFIVLLKDLGR
jgi:hypothetical protein